MVGLTDDEFYSLTPRQFHLLLEQYEHKVEHTEMLAGIISSTVANWSMGSPKKPLSHTDFMPSQWAKEKPIRHRKPTAKQLAARVRAAFEANVVVVNG